jgi:hypothetical protein
VSYLAIVQNRLNPTAGEGIEAVRSAIGARPPDRELQWWFLSNNLDVEGHCSEPFPRRQPGWLGKTPKIVVSEAWWRSLTHQWLFLHSLDSVTTVRRLVTFYVDEHNRVVSHSAFHGQTPDELYFGKGDAVPADLMSRAAAARRTRVEANRSASCGTCPPIDAAA